MRLVALAILTVAACIALTRAEDQQIPQSAVPTAPLKLDKNLRRALLKALEDLEAESAEQRKEEESIHRAVYTEKNFEDVLKKDLNKNIGVVQKSTFSFDDFASAEIPGEDKLQNSTFVQSTKYPTATASAMSIEKATKEDARSFHVVMKDKNTGVAKNSDQLVPRNVKASASTTVNKVESLTLKPSTHFSESLTGSAKTGIASSSNSLVSPKPTVSSPTTPPKDSNSSSNATASTNQEKSEEVKIFQAPLVAAFTVQQDERGIPKSVVPIYRSPNDAQALTLQEQLDFKQRLLEKQLAELQQQQLQQTQFLIRQRQLYEQQLRQKQQHQLYLQEQVRFKQIGEQNRLKQIEEQRLKAFDDPRIYRFPPNFQRKPFFDNPNNLVVYQSQLDPQSNVHLQPSVSLEVPNVASPVPFHLNYQDQLRLQQLRQQQQQQQQQRQQQQQQRQQQRLQQSFGTFPTEFQAPVRSASRFNRQEAFNAVGNFGFNGENKPTTQQFSSFNTQTRNPTTFTYNPYTEQYRQQSQHRVQQTPAKQIQHLLYQSGIAGDLGSIHGSGGPEDLNIVSKVLALNVGAVPNKNFQYTTSNRDSVGTA